MKIRWKMVNNPHISLSYSGFNLYNLGTEQINGVIFFIDTVHKQINMHADGLFTLHFSLVYGS